MKDLLLIYLRDKWIYMNILTFDLYDTNVLLNYRLICTIIMQNSFSPQQSKTICILIIGHVYYPTKF